MSVQRQANDRFTSTKPLMVSDVEALSVLSVSLRSELIFELCLPHALCHGFYRFLQAFDSSILKTILVGSIDFHFAASGDPIFHAGDKAMSAYLVESGQMEYQQNLRYSRVQQEMMVPDSVKVVSESALWTEWTHVGSLVAAETTLLMTIDAEQHCSLICKKCDDVIRNLVAEYARLYQSRVASARPTRTPWPSDMGVPLASFDEIIFAMANSVRRAISLVFVENLKHHGRGFQFQSLYSDHGKTEQLQEEVMKDKCVLTTGMHGDIERLVAVATLRLEYQGKFLAEVASWKQQTGLKVSCKLPGVKQKGGEAPLDAVENLLQNDLTRLKAGIDLQNAVTELEEYTSPSETYHIHTKYMRTVYSTSCAFWRVESKVAWIPAKAAALRNSNGLEHAGWSHQKKSVFAVGNDVGKLTLYAWLHWDDIENFRDGEGGSHALEHWLQDFQLDNASFQAVELSLRNFKDNAEVDVVAAQAHLVQSDLDADHVASL
eukprot:TRINITY_DN110249_c0_g1_i1.p2 TRINITY_DN110249_c0_g1~~TRINITY_DN110249_c0_g1_i1.p2  ORF type:complete len:490 (+),score=85.75 TRINITY_DN110249_c0_g1_i1:1506-2975(+)